MTESEKSRPDDDERRRHNRRLTCVVAEVEAKDKSSIALIRNVSESGAMLFTSRDLEIGWDVDLVIHTSSDPEGRKILAGATVMRREELDPSRSDFWRWRIGVKFSSPLDADADELAAITKQLQTD
jgi:hypothetical protein